MDLAARIVMRRVPTQTSSSKADAQRASGTINHHHPGRRARRQKCMKIDHMGYLRNHLDQPVAVIIGGGPGGLATAIEIGTGKINIILLEQKICEKWR